MGVLMVTRNRRNKGPEVCVEGLKSLEMCCCWIVRRCQRWSIFCVEGLPHYGYKACSHVWRGEAHSRVSIRPIAWSVRDT